jgi:hypothetical protein
VRVRFFFFTTFGGSVASQGLNVVRFGDRLLGLRLQQADPTAACHRAYAGGWQHLARDRRGSGIGAYGEVMRFTSDDDSVTVGAWSGRELDYTAGTNAAGIEVTPDVSAP